MSTKQELLLEEIADYLQNPLLPSQPESFLPDLIVALRTLPTPPSAEEIAKAITGMLVFPTPPDIQPALDRVADLFLKQQNRLADGPRMAFGNGVTIKNKPSDPVPVTHLTGTWGYEASTLTSGSLSATGNCVALRVYADTATGAFNISGGDTITVRGDTGFDLGPEAQLVNPVINWVSGTLDVFVAVLA